MHCTMSQFEVAKHDSFDSTTAWRSKETHKERGYQMFRIGKFGNKNSMEVKALVYIEGKANINYRLFISVWLLFIFKENLINSIRV